MVINEAMFEKLGVFYFVLKPASAPMVLLGLSWWLLAWVIRFTDMTMICNVPQMVFPRHFEEYTVILNNQISALNLNL